MDEQKSKVYIQTDASGRIIRCDGGYTIQNIEDVSQWALIDEGSGDRYNLCQANYFDGGLLTADGIPRYKWENGKSVLRSAAELAADRAAIPAPVDRMQELEDAIVELAALIGG